MSRVTGGILGFMVGGGLAFMIFEAWLASEGIGAEDVLQYLQLFFGLPVSLLGGITGAVVGAFLAQREEK
jgi:hypothetical protein